MSKQVFWPLAIVIIGLIVLASNMGLLHPEFWNLWPIIAIVVGLGGLLTSDRTEWMSTTTTKSKTSATKSKKKR